MAEQTKTEVPLTCPTLDSLSHAQQKSLRRLFDKAIALAEESGLPEEEVFQFLEDRIDAKAIKDAKANEEQSGDDPVPWNDFEKELNSPKKPD